MQIQPATLRPPAKYGNILLAHILGLFAGFFIHKFLVDCNAQSTHINRPNAFSGQHGQDHGELNLQLKSGTDLDVGRNKEHNVTPEGEELFHSVRVLCWVLTKPENHKQLAQHVLATWGRRCNHLLFMSTATDDQDLPGVVQLNVSEGRDHLWEKTRASITYIHKNYADKADWFLKTDDDTYVVVENLRHFLKDHSPKEPIYFGCRFKAHVKQGYMSGGAGYVLSREALNRLESPESANSSLCSPFKGGNEDVELGFCLESLHVKAGDSRDRFGRMRFLPLNPEAHLVPGFMSNRSWFRNWTYYPFQPGMEGCSDSAISFHYAKPTTMYIMEYLIYHLRPHGIPTADDSSQPKTNSSR